MGTCCSISTGTNTKNTVMGANLVEKGPLRNFEIVDSLAGLPIGTVCVFDNGSKKSRLVEEWSRENFARLGKNITETILPRLGVVIDDKGTCRVVKSGDSAVLQAGDLECISIVDPMDNTYVATSSDGTTYVFRLTFKQPGCCDWQWGYLYADHVARGKLFTPPGTKDNEIEATAVFRDAKGVLQMFWAGRGGEGDSWTLQAPFDVSTGNCDISKVQSGKMKPVMSPKWRNCTAIQVHQFKEGGITTTEFYFATVYDGTEDGMELYLKGDQTFPENKKVFKSALCKSVNNMGVFTTEVIAQYEGILVEAIMLMVNPISGKVDKVLLGTDDEALGSLMGIQPVRDTKDSAGVDPYDATLKPTFVNLAWNSQNHNLMPAWYFGTSGIAPAANFAAGFITAGATTERV